MSNIQDLVCPVRIIKRVSEIIDDGRNHLKSSSAMYNLNFSRNKYGLDSSNTVMVPLSTKVSCVTATRIDST